MKFFQIWFIDNDGEKQWERVEAENERAACIKVSESNEVHHFETVCEEF